MSKIDDGGAAFAGMAHTGAYTTQAVGPNAYASVPELAPVGGLTKREYFAAAALTGICANSYTPWSPNVADITDEQITKAAFDLADAMLATSKSGGSDE
jgi:hypothetical protein